MSEKLRLDGGKTNERSFAATVGRVQVGHRTADREVFIRQRNSTFIVQTRPNNSKNTECSDNFPDCRDRGGSDVFVSWLSVSLDFAVALVRGRICIPSMWGLM